MASSKSRVVDLRGGRNVPPIQPKDVRPPRERRSQLKEKRRRLRAIVTAAVCVCALLSAYAIHAASYVSRFTFQHISVSGSTSQSPAEIQQFVEKKLEESSKGYISGRNIFVYDSAPLEKEIAENFPKVKAAHVTRDTSLGNGLLVTLEERSMFARWCAHMTDSMCYLLDSNGVVFASAEPVSASSSPATYVFSGSLSTTSVSVSNPPYGEVFAQGHFVGIIALLRILQQSGLNPLGAKLESETDFSVPLAEGYYVKASYGEDPAILVKNLALILSADAIQGKISQLEYVDLRFGNRVYYKFKGQAAPETE